MIEMPVALTIAGSDSGGGAGIQADLKTFQFHKVFGTSAITCVTAQNPDGVTSISEIPKEVIQKQLISVFDFFSVNAVKTGMLFNSEIIRIVIEAIKERKIKLIIDPVMVATSGAILLEAEAIKILKEKLIPLSHLITPNIPEAEILLETKINESNFRNSAIDLFRKFKVPILLKGGHLESKKTILDFYYDGKEEIELTSEYIENIDTHGTGCTYSAAITANLALGKELGKSIIDSKKYLHQTLVQGILIRNKNRLNHIPNMQ